MQVTETTETQSQIEKPELDAATTRSARKTILACSIFALGLNACAAVYTLSPAEFTFPDGSRVAELFPDVSHLAELLPQQQAPEAAPDPVLAALKDIRSAQQQHLALLQDNNSALHQNAGLVQQDTAALGSLRQSITDERVDVKKISAQISDEHVDVKRISAQISSLIAKVDSLQSAIAPEVTSSIPKGRARNHLSAIGHKKMAREFKPVAPVSSVPASVAPASAAPAPAGPVSVGGAPLTSTGTIPEGFPAFTPVPKS